MMLYIRFPEGIRPEIIPGLPFRWYGLMYLLAFATAYLLFIYQVRKRKLDVPTEDVMSMFFWGIVGLLIGARLFATLLFDPTGRYLRQPWLIFWPFQDGQFTGFQGMNYYGGLVGAIVAIIIYGRRKKIKLLDWGDMLCAGIPLGYTFGRLGNFINAELFGKVTSVPWGFIFPHARRFPASEAWVMETAEAAGMPLDQLGEMVNLPRHPTQIYEGLTEGIILWLILWFIFRKRKPFDGFIIGAYVIGYGFFRFLIDYFRVPLKGHYAFNLSGIDVQPYLSETPLAFTASQIYSILMVLGGVLLLIILSKYHQRKEAQEGEEEGGKRSMRKMRKRIK